LTGFGETSYDFVSKYLLLKIAMPSFQKRLPGHLRKAKIIRAAGALFSEKGFSGTKTREIAVRAGVSEALIFKHFPSKEDLYAAILAEESPVPGLLAKIKDLADHQKDVEVFSAIAKTVVGGAPDSELMRLILFSALENHELSDMFFQNHIRVFYDFLAGYIQQRIDDGVFQPVPALIAARSFMGMLIYHRLLTVLFQAQLPNPAEDISHTFVSIMMNGLKISPSKRQSRTPKKRKPHKWTTRKL
jgi:AcrR family transcriptional regulator